MADGVGIAPTQPGGSLGFRDRRITALPTIRNGLPSVAGQQRLVRVAGVAPATSSFRTRPSAADITPWKMAARVGLAPTPNGLTGRRATLTPPGNGLPGRSRHPTRDGPHKHARPFFPAIAAKTGAADRISTCIVPFRRRMPHVFDHGSKLELVGTAGLGLPSPASQAPHNGRSLSRIAVHLRHPGPKPGALKTEPHSKKMADPKGVAPSTLPQTTGRSAD